MTLSSRLFPIVIATSVLCASSALEGCRTSQSVSTQMSDSEITTKVKSKMIADSGVYAHNIEVSTDEGIVYLVGRVKTEAEKQKAEEIAQKTEGVHSVVNHLNVGPEPKDNG